MTRPTPLGVVLALLVACGPRVGPGRPTASPLPDLPPPPAVRAVAPTTDERFDDALIALDALPPGDREARALRAELRALLVARMATGLGQGPGVNGILRFQQLLGLYRFTVATPDRLEPADRSVLDAAARTVVRLYAPRAGTREVLLAAAVLEAVDPAGRAGWRDRFDQIVAWLAEIEEPLPEGRRPGFDPLAALEETHRRWPSAFVRDRYLQALIRQAEGLDGYVATGRRPTPRQQRAVAARQEFPWQRVRLLVLGGALDEARRYAESLEDGTRDDPLLRTLVARGLHPGAGPADGLALAEAFASRFPDAAEQVCGIVARRHPRAAAGHLCLGRLALEDRRAPRAIAHLAAALRAAPGDREVYERLVSAFLDRLGALLAQERLDEVKTQVAWLERLFAHVAARFPGRPLATSLADVYYLLGRGQFQEGLIADAVATLARANAVKRVPQVSYQLAEIAGWRGHHQTALGHVADVVRDLKQGSVWRAYWELRTAPLAAQAARRLAATFAEAARRAPAGADRQRLVEQERTELSRAEAHEAMALQIGRLILSSVQNEELRAEVLVVLGQVFYSTGKRRLALQSFAAAQDLAPDRSSTYVDVISFLVTRGHFDEALDAYHRALARTGVTEYLKAYCTFWILDLGTRAGVDPERLQLAEVYLKHLRGNQWYHQVARYLRGELTARALAALAQGKGQRAEVDFYESMALLRQGRAAEARQRWEAIVRSDMMAFFEYQMIRRYLESGAPARPAPEPADPAGGAAPRPGEE
jgi:tetratricopeptide (TPR) repeat protein